MSSFLTAAAFAEAPSDGVMPREVNASDKNSKGSSASNMSSAWHGIPERQFHSGENDEAFALRQRLTLVVRLTEHCFSDVPEEGCVVVVRDSYRCRPRARQAATNSRA